MSKLCGLTERGMAGETYRYKFKDGSYSEWALLPEDNCIPHVDNIDLVEVTGVAPHASVEVTVSTQRYWPLYL